MGLSTADAPGATGATGAGGLIADIGGTNARFALLTAGGGTEAVRVLRCADYASLEDAARAYLADAAPPAPPQRAAIAVASPVTGDRVSMTNHVWSFSIEGVRDALGLESLSVVNDFAAVALAVPALGAADRRRVGGGEAVAGFPVVVLGPGTGLGVAALVPDGARWIPVATEGGHATLPAADGHEAAVIALIREELDHVSAERALSGPGLVRLHRALGRLTGAGGESLAPSEITARALDGADALSAETVSMFCAMLGTVAGNLALSYGALGGVYIAGGIVPRLGALFDRSPFRARFEAKGRFAGYMARIPTAVVTHPYPAFLGLEALGRSTA